MAKAKTQPIHTDAPDIEGFKVVKSLSLPAIKLEEEKRRILTVLDAMAVSTSKQAEPKKGEKARDPATICNVVDAITGERGVLICAAVIKSTFAEQYPDDDYVGKTFAIVKHAKKPGKNYATYSIDEVSR